MIYTSRPKYDYKIWNKIHALTSYINSIKKRPDSWNSITAKIDLNPEPQNGQNSSRILLWKEGEGSSKDHNLDLVSPKSSLGFSQKDQEQQIEQISEFLTHHPLKNKDIDPKEFAEFYFIYKTDLEELWAYLERLGINMRTFTVENLKQVFEEENWRRQCIPNLS